MIDLSQMAYSEWSEYDNTTEEVSRIYGARHVTTGSIAGVVRKVITYADY